MFRAPSFKGAVEQRVFETLILLTEANKGIVDMADIKLTHIREYSQGFFDPIPLLKELGVWKRALHKRTRQALRVASVTDEKKELRKLSFLIKGKGWAPIHPLPFLTLS